MIEKILLVFLFFLSFQFALHPTEGIDLALLRVVAIGIFLLWIIKSFFIKHISLPRPQILFFFFAYLLWAAASLLWAENTDWALRKVFFLVSFFPLFLVFYATFKETFLREQAFRALVSGAIAMATLALIQFFSQFLFGVEKIFSFWTKAVLPFFLGPTLGSSVAEYPSLLVNISGRTVMRAVGVFPDPHMFSFFLGLSLPIALVLFLKSEHKERTLWGAGAGILFVTDLLTFSRGGYVGLIFGMGAFFLLLLSQDPLWKKQLFQGGVAVLLVGGIIFFSPVGTRLLSSFSQTDTSNTERFRLWQESAVFVSEHPLLGSGLGNYPLTIKPTATYREPIYAHNLYLDIASELGLVGLFFFGGFLFLGFLSAWKKWYREQDLFSLAIFSSLLIFSVHSLFETPLFSVHILPLLLFLIAVAIV